MTTARTLSNFSQLLSASNSSLSHRNRLINGDGRVNQRGTVTAAATSITYGVDRWYVWSTASTVKTDNQFTGAISPSSIRYYQPGASTGLAIGQRIESANISDLAGKTATLSGWFYTTASNALYFGVGHPTSTDNFGSYAWDLQNMSLLPAGVTGSWQYFKYTFTVPSTATNGMFIEFGGATIGTSDTVSLSGVQLEAGPVATNFEIRPYPTELLLCQRYFLRYAAGVFIGPGSAIGTSSAYCTFLGTEKMRAIPTITNNGTPKFYAAGVSTSWTSYGGSYWSPGACLHVVINYGVNGSAGNAGHFYSEAATVDVSSEL